MSELFDCHLHSQSPESLPHDVNPRIIRPVCIPSRSRLTATRTHALCSSIPICTVYTITCSISPKSGDSVSLPDTYSLSLHTPIYRASCAVPLAAPLPNASIRVCLAGTRRRHTNWRVNSIFELRGLFQQQARRDVRDGVDMPASWSRALACRHRGRA